MSEAARERSFLDEEEIVDLRVGIADKALTFAQQHLFFIQDPRAAELLKLWKDTVANTRIPAGSPIDAYARAEAVRDFVMTIDRQVEIAKTGKLA